MFLPKALILEIRPEEYGTYHTFLMRLNLFHALQERFLH